MAAVAREAGASVAPSLCAAENTAPEAGCSGQCLPGLSTDLPSGLSPVPNPPSPRLCAPFTDKDGVSTEANANTELQSAPRPDTELSPPLWDSGGGKALCESGPGAEQDPVQTAVSPLSLPAAPEAPEAGLSLGQPDGPDRACTGRTEGPDRNCTGRTEGPDRSCTGRTEGGIEREVCDMRTAGEELCDAERTRRSGTQRPETPPVPDILDPDQTRPGPADPEAGPELRSGTHVRVSLDHVIDDALVVSYRVGNKVFSGVLMDLSHRFGPYGIPISTFPVRQESSRRHISASPPDEAQPPAEATPPDPVQTPLFHQGAPYPPPLFLRDSYHQGLPQPPPRRIKRSRRRYGNSEEPTCMLVRLRPRQVLCDRCKGVASTRPAPSTRRRPNSEPLDENLPTEVKRLRCDDSRPRPRRDESRPESRPRRDESKPESRSESRPRREVSRGPGPTPGAPRDLQTEVKRLRCDTSRPPRRDDTRARRDPPKGPSGSAPRRAPPPSVGGARDHRGLRSNAPGTRVLTRRISSALAPPRIRLKPHRYRTDPEPSPPPPKTRPRPGPDLRPETRLQTTNRNCKPKVQTRVSGRLRPGTKAGTRVEQKDPKTQDSRTEARPYPPLKPRLSSPSDPTPSRSRRKQVFPQPTRDFDLDFMGWSGPDSDQEQTQPEVRPEPKLAQNCTKLSPESSRDLTDLDSVKPEPENITVTETRPGPSPDPSLGSESVYAHGPNPSSHQQTETPPDSSLVQRPGLVLPESDPEHEPLVLKDSPPNHKLDLKPDPSPDLDPGLSTSLSPCLKPDVKPDHSPSHSPNHNLNPETGLNPSPDLDPSPRLVPDIDCSPDQSHCSAPGSDSNPSSQASTSPDPPSPRPVSKALGADRPDLPSHQPLLEAVGSKRPDPPCPPPFPEAMGSDGPDPPTRASRPVPKALGSDGPDPPTRASRPFPKTVGSDGPDPPTRASRPFPKTVGSDGPDPPTRASRPFPKTVGWDGPDPSTRASRPLPKTVGSKGPDPPCPPPLPEAMGSDGPDPPTRASRPVPKPVGSDGPDPPSRTPRLVPKVVSADGPDPPSRAPRPVSKTVGADGRCVCVGDIVWAKIAGFPWWPAKVLSLAVCRRGDGGGAVKQEVRVAWFGSRTTSVLPLSHSSPFLETFQARFDRKRKGPYRRAIAEAASAAKQLTPEVRALITQFET